MPRLAFKPDSSFFRKIALGAIGTRAVCAHLASYGHGMVELERGSTDTKLWKDVKRKRVRIPDLVCTNCGIRVESRAKTSPELSMSHSPSEEARAWDFGMVDEDVIAFPVCEAIEEAYWSSGQLRAEFSYWRERNWVRWKPCGAINYFRVRDFRAIAPTRSTTKGVTEGSETSIAWDATFSSVLGEIEVASDDRITIRRASDGRRHTRRLASSRRIVVAVGETVQPNQVVASAVPPLGAANLTCAAALPENHISQLLLSRERTLRFTGVKLARVRRDASAQDTISNLMADPEEDVYIRLEAAAYLAAVCGSATDTLFGPYLTGADPQNQLEAVIALGEAGTDDSVMVLSTLLDDTSRPYFLRSAAAWSLGHINRLEARARLIRAFGDIQRDIRQEALEGVVSIGGPAFPLLLAGLRGADTDIAAGCAESLRQQPDLPDDVIKAIVDELRSRSASVWTTWIVGHLPRERIASAIADLQQTAPELHYAVSLLWSFVESWIARRWELSPLPAPEVLRDV